MAGSAKMARGPADTGLPMSAIAPDGRTTLPRRVRDALGVGPGDRVRYLVLDNEVRILPVRPLARLSGALRRDGPPATLEDMERAIAEGATSRADDARPAADPPWRARR